MLLHPTSLPGPWGIGDLGPEVERFLDGCAAAGLTAWQVLPLVPTGAGDSPYGGSSAFAGNPMLLSPDALVADDLLPRSALEDAPPFDPGSVDFARAVPWKERTLRRSWEHVRGRAAVRDELRAFADADEQRGWLSDWTLFAALRERHAKEPWMAWERPLAHREPATVARATADLAEEIEFHAYVQFLFARQWARVRELARERGIAIVGDVPIYVAHDSSDVWAQPELFQLDAERCPIAVSGVPPDYFSASGQLWGNPLYRWDRMASDGFAWWVSRVRANLRQCDVLRLDHFRAFAAYWSVPAAATNAIGGEWVAGPGLALFEALRTALGKLPFVAEDLGFITEDVHELRESLGLPGMKILQFGFHEPDSEHLPHHHVPESVVYTGTHDNDTARGWFEALDPGVRARVLGYLGGEGHEIAWDMIRAALTSVADRAIVPLQDILGLGREARMNDPATPSGNWRWRAPAESFRAELAARLRGLVELSGRVPRRTPDGAP